MERVEHERKRGSDGYKPFLEEATGFPWYGPIVDDSKLQEIWWNSEVSRVPGLLKPRLFPFWLWLESIGFDLSLVTAEGGGLGAIFTPHSPQ